MWHSAEQNRIGICGKHLIADEQKAPVSPDQIPSTPDTGSRLLGARYHAFEAWIWGTRNAPRAIPWGLELIVQLSTIRRLQDNEEN